uniref:All-trans retinoic acid induced differentiation factor n=1 Tax=Apteryx owenii TaxID=8824 RepID=A0A8B9S1V8_APTOW
FPCPSCRTGRPPPGGLRCPDSGAAVCWECSRALPAAPRCRPSGSSLQALSCCLAPKPRYGTAGAGLSAPPQLRAVFRSAVPLYLECPGGSSAWEQVTTHGSSRLCQGQRNPCNSSGELGRLCPENALCAPDGPGLSQCLCSSPFHGYKCLREDAFPVLLFCGVLGAVTAVLSLLLWSTQRRKAKAP